jgi:IclR family transcriptional regulator, acetate operon repressor
MVKTTTIDRLFSILEILVDDPQGSRITDLANELGLNRAIPHRLLAELIDLGYVAQDPSTERYRATFKLGSLGLRQLETAGIPRWAQEELRALAGRSGELVRLAVATGDTLRFLAQSQGAASSLIIDSPMRAAIVLHATATGKAWLSTLPDDEIVRILSERGVDSQTSKTHTDIDTILDEVRAARANGFAVTHEEMEAGVSAIAAPIVPPSVADHRAVGTISIAGPTARLTPEILLGFADSLRDAAATLAHQWHIYAYLDALSLPVEADR